MAQSIRILLVDDDARFLDLTHAYLNREEDFSLVTEPTAKKGLKQIESGQIDCVVSDYHMPVMDGIDFLETIRADEPDLPFILFTGKGRDGLETEALAKGATTYLEKSPIPDQYITLSNQVRDAVGVQTEPPLYRGEE